MKVRPLGMCLATLLGLFVLSTEGLAFTADFEDLTLAADSYWNGPSDDEMGGFGTYTGGFFSQTVTFHTAKSYDPAWGSNWDGWAYSNMTDVTTPGWGNQYSAITGSGVDGSSNYGVAYDSAYGNVSPPRVNFARTTIAGAYFTNTTFAFYSMQDGDWAAKKFGGDDGTDPDWFLLTIFGLDDSNQRMGDPVKFYLADYRFSNNEEDYIVDTWEWVDLSALGIISGLELELTSSDVGTWGINTPTYVAMDDLTAVPIPGGIWLLASGWFALWGLRRKGAHTR